MKDFELIEVINKAAFEVRKSLCSGFLESVYKNALALELEQRGLFVQTEFPIEAVYKDKVVGFFRADILVEKRIIIELKSVATLLPIHEAQLVNYLVATNLDKGVLINYGEKYAFRVKDRIYNPKK